MVFGDNSNAFTKKKKEPQSVAPIGSSLNPKIPTPAERAQQEAEGQAYIREREKIAQELIKQGHSGVGASRLGAQQLSMEANQALAQSPENLAQQKLIQQQADIQARQQFEADALARLKQTNPELTAPIVGNTPKTDMGVGSNEIATMIDLATEPQIVSNLLSGATQTIVSASAFLPEFLQFGTKKDVEVLKAEQAFSDLSNIIDLQINEVKSGRGNPSTVQSNIRLAYDAISQLEAQTKGLGKLSLRYWLDKGKEIETQASLEKQILQLKQTQLLQAIVTPPIQ